MSAVVAHQSAGSKPSGDSIVAALSQSRSPHPLPPKPTSQDQQAPSRASSIVSERADAASPQRPNGIIGSGKAQPGTPSARPITKPGLTSLDISSRVVEQLKEKRLLDDDVINFLQYRPPGKIPDNIRLFDAQFWDKATRQSPGAETVISRLPPGVNKVLSAVRHPQSPLHWTLVRITRDVAANSLRVDHYDPANKPKYSEYAKKMIQPWLSAQHPKWTNEWNSMDGPRQRDESSCAALVVLAVHELLHRPKLPISWRSAPETILLKSTEELELSGSTKGRDAGRKRGPRDSGVFVDSDETMHGCATNSPQEAHDFTSATKANSPVRTSIEAPSGEISPKGTKRSRCDSIDATETATTTTRVSPIRKRVCPSSSVNAALGDLKETLKLLMKDNTTTYIIPEGVPGSIRAEQSGLIDLQNRLKQAKEVARARSDEHSTKVETLKKAEKDVEDFKAYFAPFNCIPERESRSSHFTDSVKVVQDVINRQMDQLTQHRDSAHNAVKEALREFEKSQDEVIANDRFVVDAEKRLRDLQCWAEVDEVRQLIAHCIAKLENQDVT